MERVEHGKKRKEVEKSLKEFWNIKKMHYLCSKLDTNTANG